ncbi:MAG: hypothetical protein SOT28_01605 [Fusicatenibacter sp.]|nr:hypothetical protein [Fusicatenibacter sp.]
MSYNDGQIKLDLTVNQKQFEKQITSIESTAKKAATTLAAAFSTKKLIEFGKSCVELGSDLAEVQNVVDVTFPSMTEKVDEFAQSAAASFGLSETMAKKFTGTFGSMAKAFGFTEEQAYDMGTTLTGLAGDVASFYNITQEEAYTKLKSVFSGETETLKELGIVMTQSALDSYALANGYGKVTAKMSEAEKVALRYAFVQDQLASATGDFSRTSGSWANQTRLLKLQFDSLKATIGQGLINVFLPVIRMINTLLGKLSTLANAFKSFTELITGNKASEGSGLKNTTSDLMDASGAADSLASSTEGIGDAAKTAAKELSLMGFDKIQKIQSQDSTSSGSAGSSIGSNIDYGSLASGETAVDKMDSKLQKLIDRCNELGNLFKNGFEIGFGDSENRIDSIRKHISGIGNTLKSVFTDESVLDSANRLFDSIAENAGKTAGSMASIGITISDNLLGGIDLYLSGSKEYIKKRLISVFDVNAEINEMVGNFRVAIADILSVFSSSSAKQCTSDLIGIFSDGFLGVLDLATQCGRDLIDIFLRPIEENSGKIKDAIENTLAPISTILKSLHQLVTDTFSKINAAYQEHVRPMMEAFASGWSSIVGTLFDGYNTYIAPVLSKLSSKFQNVFSENIQPLLDRAIELIGKIADFVTMLWNTVLQPFVQWIASTIMPILAPVIEGLGDEFLYLLSTVSKVIGDILSILNDLMDFVLDLAHGDWEKAWSDIGKIFSDAMKLMADCVRGPVNTIIGAFNRMISGITTGVNTAIRALNRLSFTVPDWVPLIGGKSFRFHLSTITAPQIPYLANGGFVKANTPRLAVIGDNKTQGEIVSPEDKLQSMVDQAVMRAGGNVSKEELEKLINNAVMRLVAALASMSFNIDGEELATAETRAKEGIDRRYNPVRVT